ncbi:restriction endonuclease subunit S [Paraburkholderia acidipaludis]|uniref:restriction endonuclease subunit S n=1 Tax=Paraburkholderia acidipaludis TaxID=660537 RepID=UPI000A06CC82|nr:restriction endonuclease subunit S [Paraburkholderia acidipaludis]
MSVAGKAGYKETSLGWLPESWQCVPQAQVATFNNGRAYKLSEWESEGTPVIRLQNLTGSGDVYYYSTLNLPDHQYVMKGDLLYMWSATFGPRIWKGGKAIYHYHIWKIDCSAKLDRLYMFHALSRFTDEMKSKTNGSTMLHLTKAGMEKEAIALPPLQEQRKIAAILTTVDDKLDVIARQIEATQTLKRGLMQMLFSRGVGTQDANGQWVPHAEFQDSELGQIPAGWAAEKLNSHVTKVGSGVTPKGGSDSYVSAGIPLIRSQNVLEGKLSLDDVVFIDRRQHEKMRNSALAPNDVLLNITGASIGRCGVLPADFDEGNVNQHVCIIRPEKSLSPHFLCHYLNSDIGQKQISKFQAGGNREGLNYQQIRSFDVPVPPVPEQDEIARILGCADEKIEVLTEKLEQYQTLKRGLMQKILTGEWRVKLSSVEPLAA